MALSRISIFVLLICCCQYLFAQQQDLKKQLKGAGLKVYTMQVYVEPDVFFTEGFLHELRDSSILISHYLDPSSDLKSIQEVFIEDIHLLKFKRKGQIREGTIVGGLAAILIGTVGGFSRGDDPPCSTFLCGINSQTAPQKAVGWATTLLVPGMLVGALLGGIKKKVILQRSQVSYENWKSKLEKYVTLR